MATLLQATEPASSCQNVRGMIIIVIIIPTVHTEKLRLDQIYELV